MDIHSDQKGVMLIVKPLIELKEGESGNVVELTGGHTFRKRMTELGFDRCSEIRVIKKGNPLIVELKCCGRIVLGFGEASKIMVEVDG